MKISVKETMRMRKGLPEDAKPLSDSEFYGYFFVDKTDVRVIYAPGEDGVYYPRQIGCVNPDCSWCS